MSFPVLICDDSPIAQKMVRRSLPENFASEITLANNGAEAMHYLREKNIALLFLDLTMPVMDGLEVLQEIRTHCLEVFVIVISGDIQPEMQKRVAKLGALDFIAKPVDKPKLASVLQKFGLY